NRDELIEKINNLIRKEKSVLPGLKIEGAAIPLPEKTILDFADTLNRLGGDKELAEELYGLFLDDAPARLQMIRAALMSNSTERIKELAHSLKGFLANIGAVSALEIVKRMETVAQENNVKDIKKLYFQLENAITDIRKILTARGISR
ncbi:MAG: Hpt domain-containing protein, partial [Spirochaetota bacterium]